jgi:hypothetical protein
VSYGIEKGREFTGRGEQKGNEAEGKREGNEAEGKRASNGGHTQIRL